MFERETEALALNCDGLLAGEGEAIHQFRICVRRLRALLELYQPVLQQNWSNRHREELRFLGKSVGVLRDTDVLRQNLSDAAVKIDVSLRDALEPVHVALAERCREQHEKVTALVRSSRYDALVGSIPRPVLKQARSLDDRVAPAELVQPLVRRVEGARAKLSHRSSPAELHRLRIRIKRLRYVLELLANGKARHAGREAKKLKRVQDVLGLQHDLVTATNWLRELAASARFPGPTLLAAGALYQLLHRRMLKVSRHVRKRLNAFEEGSSLQNILSAAPENFPEAKINKKVNGA